MARERLTRGALGLAGAAADPLRVWVKDWSATGDGATARAVRCTLEARDDDIALALSSARRCAGRAGDRGLDRKGPGVGNASYYYSVPRLAAEGRADGRWRNRSR